MQQITIIGNVGQDAVIRDHNGNKYLKFTVAVNEKYKNAQGEPVEKTNWYNIIYNRSENLAQYLKAGTQVLVQGVPSYALYQTTQNKTAISLDIRASQIQLLNSKKE